MSVTLKTAETIGNIVKQIPGATVEKWIHEDEGEKIRVIDENDCCYEINVSLPKKQ